MRKLTHFSKAKPVTKAIDTATTVAIAAATPRARRRAAETHGQEDTSR